jgi:SAM-dependent methyltransferase
MALEAVRMPEAMRMPDDDRWESYYQKIEGRAPRPILLDVLEHFATEQAQIDPEQGAPKAIDLGCGDGTESALLLARGWHVLAIDSEPRAISRLLAKVPPEQQARLQTQNAKFEQVLLSPTDLLLACVSIPFCAPQHFDRLWEKIREAIVPGGRFAGHFFGVRDSWADDPNMTFHTEAQVRAMFDGFDIEFFHEQDEDGVAASGPKHWHVFSVIAKK